MHRNVCGSRVLIGLVMLFALCASISAVAAGDREGNARKVNPKWLDRLDNQDRALLDELIGYAPPEFASDLAWSGGDAVSWQDLRGRVVLIQSWTSRTGAGREAVGRVEKAAGEFEDEDLAVIFLHTPENAEKAARYLERKQPKSPVVIDKKGAFCDALGVYMRPINIIVDRKGVVRFAGLNREGLKQALSELIAEEVDSNATPRTRPNAEPTPPPVYPPFSKSVGKAADMQGRTAPDLWVQDWLGDRPNTAGKVTILEFWATWCPPCRKSIPHLNELAADFGDEVAVIGISDENVSKVRSFMRNTRMNYFVAVDTGKKMKNAIRIKAIPNCLVVSSDWVVRWQGHPARLTEKTVRQIVEADAGAGSGGGNNRNRWTKAG